MNYIIPASSAIALDDTISTLKKYLKWREDNAYVVFAPRFELKESTQ